MTGDVTEKSFTDRVIELVNEDDELHKAAVRLVNATAALKEAKAARIMKEVKG